VHRAVATRAAVDAVLRVLVSISKGCIELLNYLLKSMILTSPSLSPNGLMGVAWRVGTTTRQVLVGKTQPRKEAEAADQKRRR